jgi:hypothetical protein
VLSFAGREDLIMEVARENNPPTAEALKKGNLAAD